MALTTEQEWLLEARGGSVQDFFAEIGLPLKGSAGVEAPVSCFASPETHKRDDKNASCSVNLMTGLWCCHGCGERGNAYRAAILKGYSEASAAELAKRFGLFAEMEKPKDKPKLPTEPQLTRWRHELRGSPLILERLRELRGWMPGAVTRLGLGWDGERLVFPIRSPRLKLAGVVRYLPGGNPKTLALPGTKRGLFPAPEIIGRSRPLFVVEGEPDAVAVWSTGHCAVAVPGAGSWRSEWAARLLGRRVVVLADCDRQGREMAARVAADTGGRAVDLESGRSDGYDIGDVVREASVEGGLGQVRRLLDGLVA